MDKEVTFNSLNRYVVVINPGQDDELPICNFRTLEQAIAYADQRSRRGDKVDVMKWINERFRTTEY